MRFGLLCASSLWRTTLSCEAATASAGSRCGLPVAKLGRGARRALLHTLLPPCFPHFVDWVACPQIVEDAVSNKPEMVEVALRLVNRGLRIDESAHQDRKEAQKEAGSKMVELLQELRGVGSQHAQRHPAGVTIHPKPHFVVKTRDSSSGRKVMLNVCSAPEVPPPGEWPHGQVPLHVKEAAGGEETETKRFPVSCSVPRSVEDDEGSSVGVLDVVFNTAVAEAADTYPAMKTQVVNVALTAAVNKTRWTLEEQVKLPRRQCYDAPPRPHPVRVDSKTPPKVMEMPSSAQQQQQQQRLPELAEEPPSFPLRAGPPSSVTQPSAPSTPEKTSGTSRRTTAPGITVHAVTFEGTPATSMTAKVTLPPGHCGAGVTASLSFGQLLVRDGVASEMKSNGSHEGAPPLATVALPHLEIEAAEADAWLENDAERITLHVRVPVLALVDVAGRSNRGPVLIGL